MDEYRELRATIQAQPGCENSTPICSNSFCRLTAHSLSTGSVDTPLDITGKLLSTAHDNPEAVRKEKAYLGQFKFTVREMLGAGDTPVEGELEERVFLRALADVANQQPLEMEVQRLAPEDIHHYVATAKGKILGREEACRALKREIERLPKGKTPDEQLKIRDQLEQLSELIRYFETHDTDSPTVNIEGTQASVQRKALFKRGGILAQNDRKVMVFKHKDGSIAIHVFIGATAVNKVAVEGKRGDEQDAGRDQGAMGHGDEEDKSTWLATRADSIKVRGRAGDQVEEERSGGQIAKEGSTVVSLYFGGDYQRTELLETCSARARGMVDMSSWTQRAKRAFWKAIGRRFGMKKPVTREQERIIEFKSQVGDVLLIPTRYAVQTLVQRARELGKEIGELQESDLEEYDPARQANLPVLLGRIQQAIVHKAQDRATAEELALLRHMTSG